MSFRKLKPPEKRLLKELIRRASDLRLEEGWEKNLLVEPMSDAGMGSLRLIPPNASPYRKFGGKESELEFDDADGTKVSATLNVDQNGHLYEIDIWKTDFTPLIRIPKDFI